MPELANTSRTPRPEFRNINIFKDVRGYRMPPAAYASILHRISGVLMFVLLPFIVWMFNTSTSPDLFAKFTGVFASGCSFVPGWFFKLVALALIWAYLHHFICGLRFLVMDTSHGKVTKEFGRLSAIFTIAVSIVLTIVLGAKLFGLY
ncbi:MAG: succinate dehydrogenase, cytochrome b556 subunit [Burkholderiaceae bacterium]|jgi:succinate dehydrogenase / fumarate reductase cytochrome b subunit|nr:succinate dehydrogenase, cytochrome b556 subunit [Burkholderiaceae bacterium]